MTYIFIAILIPLLSLEVLFSAYFGKTGGRPKWMRWLDGGILALVVVYIVIVAGQVLYLLKIKL